MIREKVWLKAAWATRRVGDRPPRGSCCFEPNFFPYHFSFLVHSTHIYPPMKMEQTVFWNVSI